MAAPDSSTRLDRGIIVIALVVVVGAMMSILDTTIVNVALATLAEELHSPPCTRSSGCQPVIWSPSPPLFR